MLRNAIVTGFVLLLVVGLYFALNTVTGDGSVMRVAGNLFFSAPEKTPDPAPAVAAATPALQQPLSGFAQKFSNHLLVMEDGRAKSFDASKLAGVKYWAFYYSASWCPPCRAFTPDLVSFYNSFKPSHPNFELIFVNDDRDEPDMLNYMKGDEMPWPAIWYGDIDNPELEAKKYCGPGIPCLVLVDANGRVLSDTMQGGQYTDPHHVIDDIRAMVQ